MPKKMGRPTTNKKTERLEIRLTPDEMYLLDECSKRLSITKTDVINKGVKLVKIQIDEKKE